MEQTLSIIKPDAVLKNVIGQIITHFENNGLKIVALKSKKLSSNEAASFYAVHKERPFFESLIKYMSSNMVVIMVLEGDNAVAKNRELMGATDPKEAQKNTIRFNFGDSIEANAVHGSDSIENAQIEINHFFSKCEIK